MAFFFVVLLAPLLVALGAFVLDKALNWKQLLVQFTVLLAIAIAATVITSCANTHDTEVWSGRVASKHSEHVSCSHFYDCNCRSCNCDSKGNNCSRCCDTCYEHSYDVDWRVETTNSETIDIDRIDRQGIYEPPRYSAARVGEPTSVVHSYTNYVKAAPGTLFRHQGQLDAYNGTIPRYPQRVYDYYRYDRLVSAGMAPADAREWNASLAELNADLGRAKQANVLVVLAKDKPADWYYALEESWIGGKKNDVVLVIDVDGAMRPQWARVMCWTTNELFKVKLRDDVMGGGTLTRESVIADLRTDISQHYVRKPMHDFEYLRSEITPTVVEWIISLLVSLLAAGGLAVFFHRTGALR